VDIVDGPIGKFVPGYIGSGFLESYKSRILKLANIYRLSGGKKFFDGSSSKEKAGESIWNHKTSYLIKDYFLNPFR